MAIYEKLYRRYSKGTRPAYPSEIKSALPAKKQFNDCRECVFYEGRCKLNQRLCQCYNFRRK